MSYSVSRRTQEIGIRMALGARTLAVQRLIVRQGMKLSLIAVAIGLPLAFAAAKFSSSLLYGVRPHDVANPSAVPVALLAVGIARPAGSVPASLAGGSYQGAQV